MIYKYISKCKTKQLKLSKVCSEDFIVLSQKFSCFSLERSEVNTLHDLPSGKDYIQCRMNTVYGAKAA